MVGGNLRLLGTLTPQGYFSLALFYADTSTIFLLENIPVHICKTNCHSFDSDFKNMVTNSRLQLVIL
jgi:hypothetical protein